MPFRSFLTRHADAANARKQAVFWLITPTGVIILLLAMYITLQSGDVLTKLNYTFDQKSMAFINHSLWWIISLNLVSAGLTVAIIAWFVSLYFGYQSLSTYWRLSRPRAKKARQKLILQWTGLIVVVAPIVLMIIWYGLGVAIQFVSAPMTPVVATTSDYNTISGYWNTGFILELLVFALPFCLVASLYCAIKRHQL